MIRPRTWLYLVCVVSFFAYSAWLIGPYLRSVFIRDAVVTAWLGYSVAPIDGKITGELPKIGTVIGQDGSVVRIKNELLLDASRTVEAIRDQVIMLRANVEEAKKLQDSLNSLKDEQQKIREQNRTIFTRQLEARVGKLVASIAENEQRLEVLQRIAERQQTLVERGTGSEAVLDAALVPLGELKLRQTELRADLGTARLRQQGVGDGIYVLDNGESPNWVERNALQLELEVQRARRELQTSQVAFREAVKDLMESQRTLDRLSNDQVTAPPGSTIVRVLGSPIAAVSSGDRIVEWVDCTDLMIDVPISDAELPFIEVGAAAKVVLEGDTRELDARVLMTRSAAAVLDASNLAAVAGGRDGEAGQILLTLKLPGDLVDECPLGRPAFVDFPGVGVLDVLRARLRI